jgi:hypothetical protein
LTHNPEIGEGVTLVVVTVAALALGLLRLISTSFELSIFNKKIVSVVLYSVFLI